MTIILQLILNGLIAGAIYALVASGFSLIYSTCKIFHLAHGAIVVFSAYSLYTLFSQFRLNFGFATILSIVLSACLGYLFSLIYKQFRKRNASNVTLITASFALIILINALILIIFGPCVRTIGFIEVAKGIELLSVIITPLQIFIIVIAFLLFLLLYFFMKKTKIGKVMRAVADNKEAAEIVGISSEKIYSLSFIIGSAIAGVAGILIALEQNLEPNMGTDLIIKGFTGAVIGGIGSVPGAVIGSFLLGLVENLGIWVLPSGYKNAITFSLLIIFLLFRPKGILGIGDKND